MMVPSDTGTVGSVIGEGVGIVLHTYDLLDKSSDLRVAVRSYSETPNPHNKSDQ